MAVNIEKLTSRLKEFEDGQKASEFAKLLWKPKEGQQTIRIVPYVFNPENPFIELKFYYGIGGKTYLAPSTFGKPDPIAEVIETLRSSGSNEEKMIADKLKASDRTYAPVFVRGEEHLGVRFWGFGITVYKQLLKLMTNPNWGDITSLTEGNDLDIEFHKESKKKNSQGKSFPETTITPCPRKTMAVDPSKRDLMEKIKNQTDIFKIFPLKSYEELQTAVNNWLNPSDATDATDATDYDADPSVSASPTPAVVSVSSNKVGEKTAAEFAAFFDKP